MSFFSIGGFVAYDVHGKCGCFLSHVIVKFEEGFSHYRVVACNECFPYFVAHALQAREVPACYFDSLLHMLSLRVLVVRFGILVPSRRHP